MSFAIFNIVSAIVQAFIYLIFARVIASFFVKDWSHGIPRFLYEVTEPVLAPVRRVVPPIGGALDISPLIVGFGLQILLGLVRSYFVVP